MKRGELSLRVLEILVELASVPIDYFLGALEISGRPTVSRALYIVEKQAGEREERKIYFKNLRQINSLIYKLKKDGLIQGQSGAIPVLTDEGKDFLRELRGDVYKGYLPPVNKYKKEKNGEDLIIVIFDIPERLRKKRDWIREVLRYLDYTMLQQSVWNGRTKLPRNFIFDLKRFDIKRYVHIFSVKEEGTINLDN